MTLAPSVAKYVGKKISDQAVLLDTPYTPDQPVPTEVIVLGAGYIGVSTAMSLRMLLDEQGKKHIPVRVLAQAFPKGISTINPGFREPEPADNYSSQVSGGWVMPVSIKPLKDQDGGTTLWCSLVRKAQSSGRVKSKIRYSARQYIYPLELEMQVGGN